LGIWLIKSISIEWTRRPKATPKVFDYI
jgi:hypothetical protein